MVAKLSAQKSTIRLGLRSRRTAPSISLTMGTAGSAEILRDGIIETVAGGGTVPLGTKPVAALSAKLGASLGPFGLAIGPNGQLYVGSNGVYRLSSKGMLYWVVGSGARALNKGFNGIYSNPAFQTDFTPAIQLAFDGKGDLLVAGGYGYGLYERTTTGRLRFLRNVRGPGASWGSLAADAMEAWCSLAGPSGWHASNRRVRSRRLPPTAC